MELLFLIIIAGVAGYLLAGSRYSKPIDQTASRVAETTRETAGNVESWFSRTFRRVKRPQEEVLDAGSKEETAEQPSEAAKPAVKQASRRKSEEPTTPIVPPES